MAKNRPKPFEKTTQDQIFNGLGFQKIYRIKAFREKWGYSAYECSFLLGKHDFFFRDAEDPFENTHFNIIDTNYLQLIFNEPLPTFSPPVVEEDTYHLKVTKYLNEVRLWVWEIAKRKTPTGWDKLLDPRNEKNRDVYEPFTTVVEERKLAELPTPLNVVVFDEVRAFIDSLLSEGFFDEPKTALDILKRCRKHFVDDFHARNMIRVINHYTNKKSGVPLLDKSKTNEFGRRIYKRVDNLKLKEK